MDVEFPFFLFIHKLDVAFVNDVVISKDAVDCFVGFVCVCVCVSGGGGGGGGDGGGGEGEGEGNGDGDFSLSYSLLSSTFNRWDANTQSNPSPPKLLGDGGLLVSGLVLCRETIGGDSDRALVRSTSSGTAGSIRGGLLLLVNEHTFSLFT